MNLHDLANGLLLDLVNSEKLFVLNEAIEEEKVPVVDLYVNEEGELTFVVNKFGD